VERAGAEGGVSLPAIPGVSRAAHPGDLPDGRRTAGARRGRRRDAGDTLLLHPPRPRLVLSIGVPVLQRQPAQARTAGALPGDPPFSPRRDGRGIRFSGGRLAIQAFAGDERADALLDLAAADDHPDAALLRLEVAERHICPTCCEAL